MRVRVPKPIRTWLQPDELGDLLAAVALVDAGGYSPKTERVKELRDRGEPVPQIGEHVGLSVPTVDYHLAKPAPDLERVGEGRARLTLLGYGGLRIGEALALRGRDVRVHAASRRLDVVDAKTPTGVREVHLSPELADVLIRYRDAPLTTVGTATLGRGSPLALARRSPAQSHVGARKGPSRGGGRKRDTRAPRAPATAQCDAAPPCATPTSRSCCS